MASILERQLREKNVIETRQHHNILDNALTQVKIEKEKVKEEIENEVVHTTENERDICQSIISLIAQRFKNEISAEGFTDKIKARIEAEVTSETQKYNLGFREQQIIIKTVLANIIGLGVIEPYMQDKDVTEIWVQRYDNICVERNGKREKVSATFSDENALQNAIQRLVAPIGRTINLSKPICDGRLPDGSRFCATIPPVSVDGATLTIRKFSDKALTGMDYVNLGSMSQTMLEFLQACVKAKCNIFISGGTNSGKTTLLNMLARSIPQDEMIITIEDSCELKIKSPNVRRLEAKDKFSNDTSNITIQELVKTSLRMSPNRIIVGEVRDGTIIDVISAMSTGHEGSMSTAHANSPKNLLNTRIPMFYKMSGTDFSSEVIAMQVAEAIDVVVQTDFIDGKRRVSKISAITKANGVKIEVEDIFKFDTNKGFVSTEFIPKRILEKIKKEKVQLDKERFALWEV